jgi:hypothetical protein
MSAGRAFFSVVAASGSVKQKTYLAADLQDIPRVRTLPGSRLVDVDSYGVEYLLHVPQRLNPPSVRGHADAASIREPEDAGKRLVEF